MPQGNYLVITTTPGTWSLKDGFKYSVDQTDGTTVDTTQFSLSSTGTMAVAGSAVLDFEKSQSYNVEVTYSDANGLESERRVMYVQLYDVNEAPVLVAKVVMNEVNVASMDNWYAISHHHQWTLSNCNNGNHATQEHHYCYTGQCVENDLAVFGDYCNKDAHCSGSASTTTGLIVGSTPTWVTTNSTRY